MANKDFHPAVTVTIEKYYGGTLIDQSYSVKLNRNFMCEFCLDTN